MATPSRSCAARAPAISALFLRALGSTQGSVALATSLLVAPSCWRNQKAALVSSMRTRFLDFFSAAMRSLSSAGSRRRLMPFRYLRTSVDSLRRSIKSSGLPTACRTAKASGVGLCCTSEPRMLKAQAMESGIVSTTASSPASFSVLCSSAIFSSAGLPANLRGWIVTGPNGGSGCSGPQTASTGLRPRGFRPRPCLPRSLLRPRDPCAGMQPGIEPHDPALLHFGGEPTGGFAFRDLQDLEGALVDLGAGLKRVAAVDEQGCLGSTDDRQAGRPGKSGKPF